MGTCSLNLEDINEERFVCFDLFIISTGITENNMLDWRLSSRGRTNQSVSTVCVIDGVGLRILCGRGLTIKPMRGGRGIGGAIVLWVDIVFVQHWFVVCAVTYM